MGKIVLRDVNVSVDKLFGRDPNRNFDVIAEDFADAKETVNKLGHDIAAEFDASLSDIKIKNATLKENRFVIFDDYK